MKSSDRVVLMVLPVIALLGGFWFLAISPKKQEASELTERVQTLEASVAEQRELASFAEAARKQFPKSYRSLISLGEAVPAETEQSSLIVQVDTLARRSKVELEAIVSADGGKAGARLAPPEPTPEPEAGAEGAEGEGTEGGEGEEAATPPPPPVPATEAAAANLPFGATVGPAGLPVVPYTLTVRGSFFQMADFIRSMDRQVTTPGGGITINGRLVTIDGFDFQRDEEKGFPRLEGTIRVTAYVAPDEEGLTLGASPAGPSTALTSQGGVTP